MDNYKILVNDLREYIKLLSIEGYEEGKVLKVCRDSIYYYLIDKYTKKYNKDMKDYLLNESNEKRIFELIYVVIKLTRGVKE